MSEITRDLFRSVLGHLPTGVTVLTAHGAQRPEGMAVNSITSLSLEPPLILVCPGKTSRTWAAIRETGAFCVNVMASHHEPVTRRFSRPGADRFVGLTTSPRRGGPALHDAIAWIDCRIAAEHDGGDHTIVVGEVTALEAAPEASPLVFFRGGYGAFTVSQT